MPRRRCRGRYGDLAAGSGRRMCDCGSCCDRFAAKAGCARGDERAASRLARQDWRCDWRRIEGTDASLGAAGGEPAGMASVVAVVDRQ